MKDLDIEKLARKNIYSTPPDFFSEVQSNVFNAVREQEKVLVLPTAGRSRNRTWYAAAAAVALVIGGTFVYNAGADSEVTIAQNPVKQDQTQAATTVPESAKAQTHAAADNYTVLAEDLTLAENEYQTDRQPETKTIKKPAKVIMASGAGADERMDMILDEFSAEDIAALSMNAEQDVYLDLYN